MHAPRHAFGIKDAPNQFNWISYADFFKKVKNFGSGLRTLLPDKAHVGICSINTLEWFVAEYACLFYSMASVPIHTTFEQGWFFGLINLKIFLYLFYSLRCYRTCDSKCRFELCCMSAIDGSCFYRCFRSVSNTEIHYHHEPVW